MLGSATTEDCNGAGVAIGSKENGPNCLLDSQWNALESLANKK